IRRSGRACFSPFGCKSTRKPSAWKRLATKRSKRCPRCFLFMLSAQGTETLRHYTAGDQPRSKSGGKSRLEYREPRMARHRGRGGPPAANRLRAAAKSAPRAAEILAGFTPRYEIWGGELKP